MILKKIFIDANVASHPETERISRQLDLPAECVEDPVSIYQWINSAADPVSRGKQVLYLTRNKGGFLKSCPGTREYTCCDYQILHVASFCTMDCAYCILQSYFHPPLLQFFVNREDLDAELTGLFQKKADQPGGDRGVHRQPYLGKMDRSDRSPGHPLCRSGQGRAGTENQNGQY